MQDKRNGRMDEWEERVSNGWMIGIRNPQLSEGMGRNAMDVEVVRKLKGCFSAYLVQT